MYFVYVTFWHLSSFLHLSFNFVLLVNRLEGKLSTLHQDALQLL